MDTIWIKTLVCFAVFSLIGWAVLFTGLSIRRQKRRRELFERTHAAGVIVDHVKKEGSSDNSGPSLMYPVVEFTAYEHTYRLRYDNILDMARWPAGSTVGVRYDGNDPTRFHLEEDFAYRNGGKNAIRFGIVWIIASAAAAVFLAVFVGGASLDGFRRFLRRTFRLR